MKSGKRILFIFVILTGFMGRGVNAQWKNIAPNLVSNYFPFFLQNADLGAIHFKDGVLWAGWLDLWSSIDSGKKWQKSNIPLPTGYIITDINFFDKSNGLVSTAFLNSPPSSAGILFITNDGGLSWRQILTTQSEIPNTSFNGSINIIHAMQEGGIFSTSTDGGNSWSNSTPGVDFGLCFTIAKDKTIFALTTKVDLSGEIGTITFSTDLGKSWSLASGKPDGDSHTMIADSCDPKRLYVASEDYESTVDPLDLSRLFITSDGGKSFISPISFPSPYFCGGMTCTANTIYASTLNQGLYRSTDQGVNWKNIGGPPAMAFDCRNIACVNDNIVFVLDEDGSIWETTNSGGDSLLANPGFNDLALIQKSLFSNDSLIVCDTSITRFINLQPIGCAPPTVAKVEVLGTDSLSYTSIPITGDSIGVNFLPLFDSLNANTLVITLSDGRQKTVSLGGFGIPRAPLVLSTQNQFSDTLGGSSLIPITLNGLHRPEDITLVIHYDTVLNYNGSFSSSGTKLDIANEQWKGRSKLFITGAIPNTTLGYAHFDIFNDSVPIQHVLFDSVTVLSAISQCEYISPASAESIITPISGCGITTISKFLHHGIAPQLSIVPNPANGDASIISSQDLGVSDIIVYDMLGAVRNRTSLTLGRNIPVRLSLPVPNGVYDIRISSLSGIYDLRIVVNK